MPALCHHYVLSCSLVLRIVVIHSHAFKGKIISSHGLEAYGADMSALPVTDSGTQRRDRSPASCDTKSVGILKSVPSIMMPGRQRKSIYPRQALIYGQTLETDPSNQKGGGGMSVASRHDRELRLMVL